MQRQKPDRTGGYGYLHPQLLANRSKHYVMSQSQETISNSYETLLVERRGRVALVTINRPEKRNALNIKTREEAARVLEELGEDDSVGVVVITGAGDKAF